MLRRWLTGLPLAGSVLGSLCVPSPADVSAEVSSTPTSDVESARELFARFCGECHQGDEPEADLDVLALFDAEPTARSVVALEDLAYVLEEQEMPPADEAQPSEAERKTLIDWVASARTAAEAREIRAGRVTARRLSRAEYANTVRDLLGVTPEIDRLPSDALGYGFDNIGDAVSFSALHFDAFAEVARRAVDEAFPAAERGATSTRTITADELTSEYPVRGGFVGMYANGDASSRIDIEIPGTYELEVTAFGQQAGSEVTRMRLALGGKRRNLKVPAVRSEPGTYRMRAELGRGSHAVSAAFLNDYYRPDAKNPKDRDRNLYVGRMILSGPLEPRPETWFEKTVDDSGKGSVAKRARTILKPFLEDAFRRRPKRAEVSRYASVVDDAVDAGDTFREGLQIALQAALCSPHFLFRLEPGGFGSGEEAIRGEQLATRLSYFLWSTKPDAALRKIGRSKALDDPDHLAGVVRDMLEDPRAAALASNFAAQWLDLRKLDTLEPDTGAHPGISRELFRSMRRETELLFDELRTGGHRLSHLLTADRTHVDARLAEHYGIEGDFEPDEFVVVPTIDGRRGILGHAGILTLTSESTRTSPVKRGKWILESLLDDAPPPPPPGADSFEAGDEALQDAASLREELARHREDPKCAICHDRLDPYGLALEGFDALGRFRAQEGGEPIDTTATLPDGTLLDGIDSVRQVVVEREALTRTFARRLFVYAIGRPLEDGDRIALDRALARIDPDPTLADVLVAIATLDAFRFRSEVPR